MEIPPAEVIDRMSIVKLKIERIGELHLQKEFEELQKAVEEFEQKDIKIKSEWFEELYVINGAQWDLESRMRKAKENGPDFIEMGKIYIELQKSNKKRVAVKNKISEETGQGFKDIKIN